MPPCFPTHAGDNFCRRRHLHECRRRLYRRRRQQKNSCGCLEVSMREIRSFRAVKRDFPCGQAGRGGKEERWMLAIFSFSGNRPAFPRNILYSIL